MNGYNSLLKKILILVQSPNSTLLASSSIDLRELLEKSVLISVELVSPAFKTAGTLNNHDTSEILIRKSDIQILERSILFAHLTIIACRERLKKR